jgi:hypothetical protein
MDVFMWCGGATFLGDEFWREYSLFWVVSFDVYVELIVGG